MQSFKKYASYGILAFALLLYGLFRLFPAAMDRIWSGGVYRVVAQGLSHLAAFFPFSLAELALVCVAAYAVVCLCRRRFSLLLRLAVTVLAVFLLLCGVNYHRVPLSVPLQLHIQPRSYDTLLQMTETLTTMTNRAALGVRRHITGTMRADATFDELKLAVADAYGRFARQVPTVGGSFPAVKAVMASPVMSYSYVMGFFFPWTLEANINKDVCPFWIPALMVHEGAHVRGYMREEEANFMVFLLSRETFHAELKYSALLFTWVRVANAVAMRSQEDYRKIVKSLDPAVRADLHENALYWQQYKTFWGKWSSKVNDVYLKANSQRDGVESYGRVVDLVLADYVAHPDLWRIFENPNPYHTCISPQN